MPLPWALRGIRHGVVTTRYPRRSDPYFDEFPATVEVVRSPEARHNLHENLTQATLDELCPTGALELTDSTVGDLTVDRGACIACGRCVEARPDLFSWRSGADVASLSRHALVARSEMGSDHELDRLRAELSTRVKALRRSVHIRHVDAGSDGSDEWEVHALLNPVYDIHRLGIFFTASPRHADILMLTGIGAAGMRAPLRKTRHGMPDPVVVMAVGTDAVSGGMFHTGYSSSGGVGRLADIDVWVPGSPASPFSILHGILLALHRVPAHGKRPQEQAGDAAGSPS
jgi:Ni,Fe-hydrogenase III small subunit/ferredoxin